MLFQRKKERRLWQAKKNKCCQNCFFSIVTKNGKTSCSRGGTRSAKESCRHFQYDPTKRVPEALPDLPKYRKEDFEI